MRNDAATLDVKTIQQLGKQVSKTEAAGSLTTANDTHHFVYLPSHPEYLQERRDRERQECEE